MEGLQKTPEMPIDKQVMPPSYEEAQIGRLTDLRATEATAQQIQEKLESVPAESEQDRARLSAALEGANERIKAIRTGILGKQDEHYGVGSPEQKN